MRVDSNAKALAAKYHTRVRIMDEVVSKTLRSAAAAIDRKQVENLSGSGDAGSYPVPVRKGTLRGGHFFNSLTGFAVVGNTTNYAMAIHSGEMTSRQGLRYAVKPRPFLDDAADSVDVTKRLQKVLHKEFAI